MKFNFAKIIKIIAVAGAAIGASQAQELAPAVPYAQEISTVALSLYALFAKQPHKEDK